MKTISTIISALFLTVSSFAGTTYTVNSNSNWSAIIPATCINCTINIASGVVLTINENITCQPCTFSGGSVSITNYTFDMKENSSGDVTTFNSTNLTASGTTAIKVNSALTLNTSTFTFNNTVSMLVSYNFIMNGSTLNLFDNSSATINGGTTYVKNSSHINVGSGSTTSKSFFKMNGPTLDLYDDSYIALANQNNYYFNWGSYNYYPSAASSTHTSRSTVSTLNCNGSGVSGYSNSCSGSNSYGPSIINSIGTVPGTILPVVLMDFSAVGADNNETNLIWHTAQESNSSHFDIQRSATGSGWVSIGSVQAAGNSSKEIAYSFADANPLQGVNYYRIGMIDLNGKEVFTDVKVVSNTIIKGISIFPNPAHDYVNVSLGEGSGADITVTLVSQSGQVLQAKKVAAGSNTTVSFPVQQYTAGLYILHISSADGFHQNAKVLLAK